jgi:hypothetical protein
MIHLIDGIVGLVADEHHARAGRHVPEIGDIDEQLGVDGSATQR